MDKTDFQKKYRQYKWMYTAIWVISFALYVLAYAHFVSAAWKGYGELVLLFLVVASAIFLADRCMRRFNKFLGSYAEKFFSESFDLEQYLPNSRLPRKDCRASRLFSKDYGYTLLDISCSNLVIGRYRGIRFNFSDLMLFKGRGSRRRSAAFCVMEHQGSVNGRILMRAVQEHWWSTNSVPESAGFDERFEIKGNDQEDVSHVLTPDLKRTLVQLDKAVRADADGRMVMDICIDANRVYIALWNKSSLFSTGYKSFDEFKAAAGEDVRWITTCMDAFLDHSTLFPHAALSDAGE